MYVVRSFVSRCLTHLPTSLPAQALRYLSIRITLGARTLTSRSSSSRRQALRVRLAQRLVPGLPVALLAVLGAVPDAPAAAAGLEGGQGEHCAAGWALYELRG